MAVGLSLLQTQSVDTATSVLAALDRHGLHPSDLALGLRESALVTAGNTSRHQLMQLRARGVSIGINDFGAGYASLRHLAILPVDAIKVDASFTAGLPHDPTSITIVRAVAGFASEMGLRCVFDGIDTARQLAALPRGVVAQGAFLGLPSATPPLMTAKPPLDASASPSGTNQPHRRVRGWDLAAVTR